MRGEAGSGRNICYFDLLAKLQETPMKLEVATQKLKEKERNGKEGRPPRLITAA